MMEGRWQERSRQGPHRSSPLPHGGRSEKRSSPSLCAPWCRFVGCCLGLTTANRKPTERLSMPRR